MPKPKNHSANNRGKRLFMTFSLDAQTLTFLARRQKPIRSSWKTEFHQWVRRDILQFVMNTKLILTIFSLACWVGMAEAQYILVLKNGRQITVQSYRTEGSMIKFNGLGGEIAISKEQIEAIRPSTAADQAASPSLALDRPTAPAPREPALTEAKPSPTKPIPPAVKPEEQLAKQRAEEEKAYQRKVKELTEQLEDARDRYSLSTRGNKGPEPFFFTTEEAFRGQQEDLLSRLRDAQNRAQGLETGSAAKAPPFSLNPPPAYSDKQRELSDMRARMIQLENDRQKLIDEMKTKNFDSGSVYLE